MADLAAIVNQPPATTIDDVLARLDAIDAALDPADGIACFNKLYARVTSAVLAAYQQAATFTNPAFLETLDVVFANLYFSALRAWHAGDPSLPRAWAPLFDAHARKDVHPLQFALAGMNAHINRDLPVALNETSTALGAAIPATGPEHDDYQRVDAILAEVEVEVKGDYFGPLAARIDRHFDGVDDVVAMWGVRDARDAAWVNGQTLWALRASGALHDRYLSSLDGIVGFAGRGLLVPTAV